MILSGANAGQADEYMLWLDADGSGDDEFIFEHGNGTEVFNLDSGAVWDSGNWEYFMVTGEDAPNEVNFFFNGVPDDENPDPQTMDAMSIDPGGLVVGQNQSGVGTFSNGNRYIGQLDELRFASVVRTPEWAATVHANQSTTTDFYSTSTQLISEADSIGWYSTSWEGRQGITLGSVPETLTDFPVYIDLATLGSAFFSEVASDGS